MQRELERDTERKREEDEEEAPQMSKCTRTVSRRVSSCGNRFREGEHCKKGVDKKNEKPKLVLVEYYVFDGQFACYRNSREKGEKKEKKTLNFR